MHDNYSKQLDNDTGQFNKEKKYWLTQLSGEPEPHGFQIDFTVDPGKRIPAEFSWELPDEIVSKLLKLSNNSELRLYIALTAGITALIHKYTGKEDIIIGAPIFRQTIEGQLINTVLSLRNNLAGDINFRQLLMQVSKTLYDANENQNYPIETLLYKLNIPYSKEMDFPLFDTAVLLENLHEREYLGRIHLKMIFSFYWEKQENRIRGKIVYNAGLYRESSIKRIIKHFIVLMEAVFRDMDLSLRQIDIVPGDEKQQLLYEFNNTAAEYPQDKTIHQLFEEQVSRTPDQISLVGANRHLRVCPARIVCPLRNVSLTYRQLNNQSDHLAGFLIEKDVLPDSIIGIMMERSVEMVIAIFGILKSGGAYLPIDPGYPEERIEYMLKDSRAAILLTDFEKEKMDNCQLSIVNYQLSISGCPRRGLQHSAFDIPRVQHSNHLCYIIYTSGTTGGPKGVMVEHRNALNTVTWYARKYGVSGGTRVLQISDYTFDPSVEQIFGTLLHGASLFIVTKETRGDIDLLRRFIDVHQVQIINFVPMVLKELLGVGPVLKSLRAVMSGGDKLEETVKDLILEKGYELYNHYGPTEITVDALTAKCTPGPVVLGKPITNVNCYILGNDQELMPIGVAGELYIGGCGVTRGYLNNPGLTADRFNQDLWDKKDDLDRSGALWANFHHSSFIIHHSKLYRTGDRARWLSDGNIEFLGRIDHQVKIRGFRVELGEIENLLRRHSQVNDALVIAVKTGESGNKNLCAYFTVKTGSGTLDIQDLKEYLSVRLPGYMIPVHFCRLDEMPLTPGGKINRKALPLPREQESGSMYIPPRDALEKTLVALWAEVLEMEPAIIGIDTDFFECGGHSLNATVLAARIHKELNVKVPMMVLFETPFIRGLARYIQGAAKEKHKGIEQLEEKEYYPLSSAQKRLYILQQMEPNSIAYNLPVMLELEGSLDKEKLEGVFKQLIQRHESFRTSFEIVNEEPVQRIHKDAAFKIEYWDTLQLNRLFIHPFDLAHAPLLWVALTKMDESKYQLTMDMHHIISDGISTGIMIREFTALYEGKELPLLKLQYKDFSNWQHDRLATKEMKKQEAYWQEIFSGPIPVLQLPYDYPRPTLQSTAGNSIRFQFEPGETALLKGLSRKENVTFFTMLLSIYIILLSRLGNNEDIVMGTPVAGRNHVDLQGIIGMLVNTLALRNTVAGPIPYSMFLDKIKEQTTASFENQDYPFEILVEKLSITRDTSRNPLFDVMFSFENLNIPALEIKDLNVSLNDFDNNTAKFDLNLNAVEFNDCLLCKFEYCTKLFKKETIERFILYFKEVVSAITNDIDIRIAEIDIIPPGEREQLLFQFNDTNAEFPVDKTIHELFAAQVKKTPDHIAVVGADLRVCPSSARPVQPVRLVQLTYNQLDEQSDRLAGLLIEKGVLPDDIIGIMLERSVEMIIGIIGILKAGGAYLPIDPAYPQERIDYMLKDSKAKLTINYEFLNEAPQASLHHSSLDLPRTHHSNLAYVIYTSGSTGKPKGVMIEHRSVVNLLFSMQSEYPFTVMDTYLLKTSYMFDVSVTELFGWYMGGGKVAILEKDVHGNPQIIANAIEKYYVSHINFVPSMFNALSEFLAGEKKHQLSSLKYIFIAGEPLLPEFIEKFRELNTSITLENIYGPTESTVYSSKYSLSNWDGVGNIPIGKPLPNLRLYILNKYHYLQPVGIAGELYISGSGLARGYLNNPELTAERFQFNRSYRTNKAYIVYKTGDLTRWLLDGNIEFLGRIDQQVKIRGFRIELGEIEHGLKHHHNVKEAVVIDRTDKTGEKYLCAYIVFRDPDFIDYSVLKTHLSQTLPKYMIPTHFVTIEKIPLNLNGKVNRHALPEPGAKTESKYMAPGSDSELKITEVWEKVLGTTRISTDENFFDAGGNSLKIIKLAIELNKHLEIEIPVAKFFQYPTIASQARYIDQFDKEKTEKENIVLEPDKIKNKLKQRRNKIRS